jgi:hypothetical protein
VEHLVEADSRAAIAVASGEDHRAVEVIGNYTAFRDLLEAR